jgi:putative transposase
MNYLQDGPILLGMARKPRIHIPGGLYHVILRGNAGNAIFKEHQDYNRLCLLIQIGIERYSHRIHAFCFMTNHIHFAIQVAQIPLSKIMHNLTFRYTQWINKRNNSTGHIFQGRYKAILVDAENYLLELVRYIHLNPVRAKLVKFPDEFHWSSHNVYLGREKLTWLSTDWVLGHFSDDYTVARERYEEFVADEIGQAYGKQFHVGRVDSRVLGVDDFLEKAEEQDRRTDNKKKPQLNGIVSRVCLEYKIREDDLKGKSRNREFVYARGIVSYIASELGTASLKEVAEVFSRDPSALSKLVVKIKQGLKESEEYENRVNKIMSDLTQ